MATRLFYQSQKLHTLLRSDTACSLLHAVGIAHAEQQQNALGTQSLLLATNEPGSVLQALTTSGQAHALRYTAYGEATADMPVMPVMPVMMFNGQWQELLTGCYPLGNGYRMFSTVLMRFHAPDSMSPFGAGGINAYAYCADDPVNNTDPSGHMFTRRQILNAQHHSGTMVTPRSQVLPAPAGWVDPNPQPLPPTPPMAHSLRTTHGEYLRSIDGPSRLSAAPPSTSNLRTPASVGSGNHATLASIFASGAAKGMEDAGLNRINAFRFARVAEGLAASSLPNRDAGVQIAMGYSHEMAKSVTGLTQNQLPGPSGDFMAARERVKGMSVEQVSDLIRRTVR